MCFDNGNPSWKSYNWNRPWNWPFEPARYYVCSLLTVHCVLKSKEQFSLANRTIYHSFRSTWNEMFERLAVCFFLVLLVRCCISSSAIAQHIQHCHVMSVKASWVPLNPIQVYLMFRLFMFWSFWIAHMNKKNQHQQQQTSSSFAKSGYLSFVVGNSTEVNACNCF